jgi:hypothetical protein
MSDKVVAANGTTGQELSLQQSPYMITDNISHVRGISLSVLRSLLPVSSGKTSRVAPVWATGQGFVAMLKYMNKG